MLATIKTYATAILIVGILAGAAAIYGKGRLDASHAAELAAIQTRLNQAVAAKELAEKTLKADQLQAMKDAEDKERLNALIDSQAALLKDADADCFTPDDTDRVRSLWGLQP